MEFDFDMWGEPFEQFPKEAACGIFQLTDRKYLEEHFELGKEMICYDNPREVKESVRYYLAHHEERMAIAKRAQAKVLRRHTYRHRMQWMLEKVS